MSVTALAPTSNHTLPSRADWAVMLEMSDVLVKSGMLPSHIKTPQAAVAIIQKGIELGIPPMHALSNIVNIQGKPTANAELMLALIYRDHGDGAVRFAESTAERCVMQYKRRNWPDYLTYAFTMDDAKRAQLAASANWQKYPAAMLRARCISAVARMAYPDSIGGMYTPEELGAAVEMSGEGEVVVAGMFEPPARPAVEVLTTGSYPEPEGAELNGDFYQLPSAAEAEAEASDTKGGGMDSGQWNDLRRRIEMCGQAGTRDEYLALHDEMTGEWDAMSEIQQSRMDDVVQTAAKAIARRRKAAQAGA